MAPDRQPFGRLARKDAAQQDDETCLRDLHLRRPIRHVGRARGRGVVAGVEVLLLMGHKGDDGWKVLPSSFAPPPRTAADFHGPSFPTPRHPGPEKTCKPKCL